MNRSQKLSKLGSAIRDYRGRYNPSTGKWIVHPRLKAKRRVIMWLERLGIDVAAGLETIEGFESVGDYREWMRSLQSGE